MLAVQPDELPVSLLTQWSDCVVFIIGISFAFRISWWRYLKPHISPAFSDAATPIHSNSLWFLLVSGKKTCRVWWNANAPIWQFQAQCSRCHFFPSHPLWLNLRPFRQRNKAKVSEDSFFIIRGICALVYTDKNPINTLPFFLVLSHRQLCQGRCSTYP